MQLITKQIQWRKYPKCKWNEIKTKQKQQLRETTEHTDYRGTATYNKGDGYQIDY